MIKSIFKVIILLQCLMCYCLTVHAQVTTVSGDYIHKKINSSGNTNYAKSLILLHEIYDGTLLGDNYIVGTLLARRGGVGTLDRLNVANINSSSAYNATYANLISSDEASTWKLKTCKYNGKKYLAVDVPYLGAFHASGFQFVGWSKSTGVALEFLVYDINGVAQNNSILTDISDYQPSRHITNHVSSFNVMGKVGIGTIEPKEALSVNGNIRARQIKVETANWPDYVFNDDYQIPSLVETEKFIQENGHLPEVPKAIEIERNGVDLGEMNKILLKKMEEITLHLIQKDKEVTKQQDEIDKLKRVIEQMQMEIKMKK